MRNIVKDLRFMIRDAWASRGSGKAEYVDTFSKTLREASHVRGGSGGAGGGAAFASSERTLKHIKDGHENYAKSFEDPNELKK